MDGINEFEFIELVHKFRDETAIALHFQPSIEFLVDTPHCEALSRIIHKPNVLWEKNIAVPNLAARLPEENGLYMFVWRPELVLHFAGSSEQRFNWVLYVGKAGKKDGTRDTLKHRYQSEYSKYVARDPSCLWKNGEPAFDREARLARYLTLRP